MATQTEPKLSPKHQAIVAKITEGFVGKPKFMWPAQRAGKSTFFPEWAALGAGKPHDDQPDALRHCLTGLRPHTIVVDDLTTR